MIGRLRRETCVNMGIFDEFEHLAHIFVDTALDPNKNGPSNITTSSLARSLAQDINLKEKGEKSNMLDSCRFPNRHRSLQLNRNRDQPMTPDQSCDGNEGV
ncbi:hypothetical protein MCOR25_006950 [Pyricularia grisea]|nr:hypothetical protein MCOR25_006950 [Pyricularia grisea]